MVHRGSLGKISEINNERGRSEKIAVRQGWWAATDGEREETCVLQFVISWSAPMRQNRERGKVVRYNEEVRENGALTIEP